ncbi:MAG: glycosyltransferase [Corynebacteriales bacterium]|nr:glycosyltransferase [Mycobacteriales bacterium]
MLVEYRLIAKRLNPDATIGQNFTPLTRTQRAAFIQDVLFVSNPEWFTRAERAYFSLILRSARRADKVLTSSRTEAARMAAAGVGSSNTPFAVGLGLSPALLEAVPVRPPFVNPQLGEFLLTVGRLNVRKNLGNVIEGVRPAISPERPLIVVGARDGAEGERSQAIDHLIDERSVIFSGTVSDPELSWLYRNCRLFLCLSLDEGYGLPPVEARTLGSRVLVSERPVFRETLGAAATYVDPLDVPAIRDTVAGILLECRRPTTAFVPPAWSDVAIAFRSALTSDLTEPRDDAP